MTVFGFFGYCEMPMFAILCLYNVGYAAGADYLIMEMFIHHEGRYMQNMHILVSHCVKIKMVVFTNQVQHLLKLLNGSESETITF